MHELTLPLVTGYAIGCFDKDEKVFYMAPCDLMQHCLADYQHLYCVQGIQMRTLKATTKPPQCLISGQLCSRVYYYD